VEKKINKYFVITGEGMRMYGEIYFLLTFRNLVIIKNYIIDICKEGINPVLILIIFLVSKTRCLYCLKIAEPSVKFKYLLITYSEIVLWRKGEKVFKFIEVEIVLKFKVYRQLKLYICI